MDYHWFLISLSSWCFQKALMIDDFCDCVGSGLCEVAWPTETEGGGGKEGYKGEGGVEAGAGEESEW